MSTIPMKEFPGDVGIGRHSIIGGNATVRGEATVEHNLTVKGWLRARNIIGSCRGVYGASDDLVRRDPAPLPGMWAVVKSPTSEEITQGKIWLENHGRWVETEILLGESTIGHIWSEELYEALENSRKALEGSAQCQEGLAAETAARRTADSALSERLTNETEIRRRADTALSERINEESNTRFLAIKQIRDYIQEEAARLALDISSNRNAIVNIDDYIIPHEIQPQIDCNREAIDSLNDCIGAPTRTVENELGGPPLTRPGIAPLDESGRVPGRFLPSYVDDAMDFDGMALNVAAFAGERYEGNLRDAFHRVLYLPGPNRFILEVTPSSSTGKPQAPEYYPKWELGEEHALCMGRESEEGYVPLKGKTYYCPATNKAYRWTGSSLVPTGSDLDLGEEAGTAFAGDRGRALELEKADRTELSPVMVRDAEEGAEMPEPDFPALMLRKNEQALTAEERRQVMVNLGRPDTAAFDLQWEGAGGTVFVPGELYGLNGINDITLAEAMKIWRLSHRGIKESWNRVYGYGNGLHEPMKQRMFARTYFTLLSAGYANITGFKEVFLGNEIVEAVDIAGGYAPGGIQIGLNSTFNGCKNLRRVSFGGGKGDATMYVNSEAFAGCVNLERIDVFKFPMDDQTLDLSMAPRFEVDCIEKTVNALFTSSHNTIILHPDVFAKCSPELLAAAEAKFLTITTP